MLRTRKTQQDIPYIMHYRRSITEALSGLSVSNGLDTPHWKEDIRVCVAGGADTIRIAKTESAQDVHTVEEHVLAAEREFGRPEGSTLLMAALESCKGVLNALEVCKSSDRLIGIALSGGDYTKDLQTVITGTGVELQGARQQMIIAARAAGVQCWDTVFTNLDAMDVFEEEVKMIKMMGFDGKSLVNPRQIDVVHKIFTPDPEGNHLRGEGRKRDR